MRWGAAAHPGGARHRDEDDALVEDMLFSGRGRDGGPTTEGPAPVTLRVEYCDVWSDVPPGRAYTIGREGDLVIDDNPYLNQRFLELVERDGVWWLCNVGTRLAATLSDAETATNAWLPPLTKLPIVFPVSVVRFTAGPTSYELTLHLDTAPFTPGPSRPSFSTSTTGLPPMLNAEQRLLVLALAEPSLLHEGHGSVQLPSSLAAAARLGWPITKFNRKLDHLCEKLERAGVRGLHGSAGHLASGRRARLVQYALVMRLVSAGDLYLFDQAAPGKPEPAPQRPGMDGS